MYSGNESYHDPISTEMFEENRGGSQSHPKVTSWEARYKICYRIKEKLSEWKLVLLSTRKMGKGLHKIFKTVVRENLRDLPPLGESGSEVSHFIPEPRNFAEVTKLSDDKKKPWLKATLKEIKNLIHKQTF